jgi:hypothetical protein
MKRIAIVIGALTLGGALIASSHAASFGAVPSRPSASPSGLVAAVPTLPLLAPRKIMDLEEGQPRIWVLGGTLGSIASGGSPEELLDLDAKATEQPLQAKQPLEMVFGPPCFIYHGWVGSTPGAGSSRPVVEAMLDASPR